MIAEAMVGHGDRALDYYLRINPSAREAIREVHRCEPYVYAQMIAGRDAPTHGEAKNSWLTGTAAWNYVAVTQWILGIRPEHDGLRDRSVPAGRVGRRRGDPPVPRLDLPDRHPQAGRRRRPGQPAHDRRPADDRQPRAAARCRRAARSIVEAFVEVSDDGRRRGSPAETATRAISG